MPLLSREEVERTSVEDIWRDYDKHRDRLLVLVRPALGDSREATSQRIIGEKSAAVRS